VHCPLAHATAVLHVPVASQVSTPLPEHWVVEGTQPPVHAPATQLVPMHKERLLPKWPVASHVSTLFRVHCFVAGAHVPTHTPVTQAWLPQSMGEPHVPEDAHTSTALPEHRTAPAVHSPPPSPLESPAASPPAWASLASKPDSPASKDASPTEASAPDMGPP
jgi:hypothetical protein